MNDLFAHVSAHGILKLFVVFDVYQVLLWSNVFWGITEAEVSVQELPEARQTIFRLFETIALAVFSCSASSALARDNGDLPCLQKRAYNSCWQRKVQ